MAVKLQCFPTINSIFLAMYDTAEDCGFHSNEEENALQGVK